MIEGSLKGQSARRPAASAAVPNSGLATLAVGFGLVAALYLAREIFMPLAIAILLSFVLVPLVSLLRQFYLGRIVSVLAAVFLASSVIFGIGAIMGNQVAQLAENLPQYQTTIKQKIRSINEMVAESGLFSRAKAIIEDLSREIAKPAGSPGIAPETAPASPRDVAAAPPAPVQVQSPNLTPLEIVKNFVLPLLEPLATTGLVIVFVIFILLQREDLRDRFIRLAGAGDLQRTTESITDAAERVSYYMLMQTAVNAAYGVPVAIGLWIIGVPNPILWGILAMLLRFVPYIGPWIAAIFPLALSIAVDPGWTMLLWTAALFVVLELLSNNVLEPRLYGASTGLSPVAIILSATFWTWLWGPIGLVLSTPLTTCLAVLGQRVPRLEFLDILLSDRPALAPEESFYQRILAADPDEAADQAEQSLKTCALSEWYDDVAIKALTLAQIDAERGRFDAEQLSLIRDTVLGVIDDLSDYADEVRETSRSEENPDSYPPSPILQSKDLSAAWRGKPVLCLAGRTALDGAAAAMLAQLLEKHGIGAEVMALESSSAAPARQLDAKRMLCVSYLDSRRLGNARYLVRRLRRKMPDAEIMVGFWTLTESELLEHDAKAQTGADIVVASLRQAVAELLERAKGSNAAAQPRKAAE